LSLGQLGLLNQACIHCGTRHSSVKRCPLSAGVTDCSLPHAPLYCRWSDAPDTVVLHQLPHKALTAPARLGDFDFCTPAGSSCHGYPTDMSVTLRATAAGRLNSLVLWFDLHLAEGVSLTSGVRCGACVVWVGLGWAPTVVLEDGPVWG
jgi:hypothetical protein